MMHPQKQQNSTTTTGNIDENSLVVLFAVRSTAFNAFEFAKRCRERLEILVVEVLAEDGGQVVFGQRLGSATGTAAVSSVLVVVIVSIIVMIIVVLPELGFLVAVLLELTGAIKGLRVGLDIKSCCTVTLLLNEELDNGHTILLESLVREKNGWIFLFLARRGDEFGIISTAEARVITMKTSQSVVGKDELRLDLVLVIAKLLVEGVLVLDDETSGETLVLVYSTLVKFTAHWLELSPSGRLPKEEGRSDKQRTNHGEG